MALLTLTQHKVFASICGTDVTRDAALQEIIDEANDAVLKHCKNGNLEETEYTVILDGPLTPAIVLPFAPVTYDPDDADSFQFFFNVDANSDPSAFTSDDRLEMFIDFALDVGPATPYVSESGIVRFLNGVQGVNRERPLYSLSTKIVPLRGAIKVVYTAGYDPVPPSLRAAVNMIVRKIFNARKLGVAAVSESLGGYSYSAQSSATAEGLIAGDPTIRKLLVPFTRPQVGRYA